MKRKLTFMLAVLMFAALAPAIGLSEGADAAAMPSWTLVSGTGASINNDNANYGAVTGSADAAVTLRLDGTVNVSSDGFYFEYLFADSEHIDIDAGVRTNGKNYIKTTVANGDDSIVILSYARYTNEQTAASQIAKMQHDVFYYNPELKRNSANNHTADGSLYLETVETYVNVTGSRHTVELYFERDILFIGLDGLCVMPNYTINELDLDGATVTLEVYSKGKAPSFRIYPANSGFKKQYIQHDYVQFGSCEVTELPDDTVRYRVKDKRADQFAGTELRYREQLISATGYDVRQPITVEFSYDVSNASAVWYAVGLGRPGLYDDIEKLRYDVYGYSGDKGKMFTSYGDGLARINDGIMFQTTTGRAQPTNPKQNSRLADYYTNSASKPYSGRGNVDVLTFIVGETGTDLYHNGELLFSALETKLSDFAGGNYMAYPYFHFFEDKANSTKGNTIVIKGVNAPERTDDTALRLTGGSNEDVTLGLDAKGNGDITLYDYRDGVYTEIDGKLYDFDAEKKELTVKYAYFEDKPYDICKLYARNNSGSEEISVRFSDPELATKPPEFESGTYYWKVGAGTEDLVLNVDIKNGEFYSFSGAGITAANWTYIPGDESSTVGSIVIDKTFLNNKKEQSFTFTLRTKNIEDEYFEAKCTLVINKTGEADGTGGDDGPGGGDGGCKGFASVGTGGAAVAAAGIFAAVLRKKRTAH